MGDRRFRSLLAAVGSMPVPRRELVKGGLGLLLGAAVGGLQDQGSDLEVKAAPVQVTPDPQAAPVPEPAEVFQRGSTGGGVLALQQALNAQGYWCGDADGGYGHLAEQAVIALQKVHGLATDGIAGPATQKALATGRRPDPVAAGGDRLEIQLGRQLAVFYRGGVAEMTLNTSTGNGEPYDWYGSTYSAETPAGDFTVYRSYADGWEPGPLGDLYKPLYFNGGIALHGAHDIPAVPASHGCARISVPAMDRVWDEGWLQMGSRVVVA